MLNKFGRAKKGGGFGVIMSDAEDVGSSVRSLSDISEEETVRLSVDLVAAARHNLGFLRLVADSDWLHHKSTIRESIRRFHFLVLF